MSLLDYFLKANLYAGLFAGCYWLLLRRHTFFGVNRAYLLASVVGTLVLPLARLPTQTLDKLPAPLTAPIGVIALPTVTVSATAPDELATLAAGSAPVANGFDWSILAGWLYGAVAAWLLLRLVWHVMKLVRTIHASAQERYEGYILVQPNDADAPTFSFFHYLVLNPADADNALIFQHELVHIRQRHSLDVLTVATLQAVFWACPALWLLDRALREVHEFLADRVAIRQVADQSARPGVEQYARFLIDYAFGVRPDALTNGFFNPSLLKRRIQMMQQRATNRWALGKYALVLPLAFGLLAMTTTRQEITAILSNTITVTGRVTNAADGKPLPGVTIVVKGKTQGTATDTDGKYTLTNLTEPVSLVYSFVGFATKEVRINGKSVVNVELQSSPNALPKIVVASYGPKSTPLVSTTTTQPTSITGMTGEVVTVVEQQPEFPGGRAALGQYLARSMRYPAKAQRAGITGTVLVHFTVTADGTIEDAFVEKGIGGGCNEEALHVVGQMPLWKPGKQNGKPIAVPYVLPIEFALEYDDKRTGYDDRTFKPLNSPIVDFPVVKPKNLQFTDQSMNRYGMPARSKEFIRVIPSDVFYTIVKPNYTRWSHVSIRGKGPLGPLGSDQQPLYITDGVEVDSTERKNRLNPNNIQSIEVLKDASVKAAYGEKGRNGVIIITTKKP